MNTPPYLGCLNQEELIDWIGEIEKFFDLEGVEGPKKVKFACTNFKGHASLLQDTLQLDIQKRGKEKIRHRENGGQAEGKIFPCRFLSDLLKKLQDLRQREMSVKDYTEEVYRVSIRSGKSMEIEEVVARYVNGLRYLIQYEISMVGFSFVNEAYQLT
jgi:hypothetical protein